MRRRNVGGADSAARAARLVRFRSRLESDTDRVSLWLNAAYRDGETPDISEMRDLIADDARVDRAVAKLRPCDYARGLVCPLTTLCAVSRILVTRASGNRVNTDDKMYAIGKGSMDLMRVVGNGNASLWNRILEMELELLILSTCP